MLCEKCGAKNATTHIRTVVNGVVHEKHLCSHCAASETDDIKNNNLTQMLSNMFGDMAAPVQNKITRCSCCGSTYADIAESGKCGCAECYNIFYEQLLPYFKRVHGSTKHIGKKLDCTDSKLETNTIDELRNVLKKLVEEENYEQAAVIRDKIKNLQEGV